MIYLEADDVDIEFTREEISTETDAEKLRHYRDLLKQHAKELSIEIGAFLLGGIEQPDMCFKLGRLNIGLHWVERRLSELSADEPTTKEARQAAEIKRLHRAIEDLKAENMALRSSVSA